MKERKPEIVEPGVKGIRQPNQLYPELMSISSLQPWDGANSSGRKYMFAGHLGQALAISEPTERRCQTGMENEYGKYTNNIKMPVDGTVLEVMDIYPETIGSNIEFSPTTYLIYEDRDGILGCVEINRYYYNYHHYGFAYSEQPGMAKVRPGQHIAKDTVFMDSTAIGPKGEYRYGREVNVAFFSHHASAEDAIIMASDLPKKFGFRTYEKRSVSWGKDKFPINLYGDDKFYKPFPDIGEYVHPRDAHRGLLMALREYNDDLAIVDQNKTSVNYHDPMFDECIYAAGEGGRVVDIRIYHNETSNSGGCDEEMSRQPMKYYKAYKSFCKKLIEFYQRKRKERGDGLVLTHELHRLIVDAYAITGGMTNSAAPKDKIEMIYRKKPLDEWRVEFTIEYCTLPNIGSKMTDSHGGILI